MVRKRYGLIVVLSATIALTLTGCVRPATSPYPVTSASASTTSSSNCDGKSVTLNHPATRYILTGDCQRVSIQGQDITVTIDKAKEITINGDRNNLTVRSAGGLTIEGQDNSVSATAIAVLGISGDRNSVAATTLGTKTVSGNGNTVLG
jgi:hypothetical protein